MKQLFLKVLALLAILVPSTMYAYDFEVDGIYYERKASSSDVVSVTYGDHDGSSYSGDVVIPESVIYRNRTYRVLHIGSWAFENCTGLTSVIIPNSVTVIYFNAFAGCSNLASVTMGNSVNDIYSDAFRDCTSLTGITIPDSVKYIRANAFENCSSLTSINIPSSVTSIESYAFSNCSSLAGVYINDLEAWCKISFGGYEANPLSYAHHLFLNGEEVKYLVIPDSITTIGKFAFEGCSGLTSITIPDSVTSIGSWAFAYCSSLSSVSLSNSIIDIGYMAFYDCTSLTSVDIPGAVTTIDKYAFSGCTSLTRATIGNSVTSIGDNAFSNCSSLAEVTIGNSVTEIGNWAFSSCSGLTSIICHAANPPTIYNNTFRFCNYNSASLYVPAESLSAYQEAEYWNAFANILPITPSVLGDVNGDGALTVSDVTMLINMLLNSGDSSIDPAYGDCNGDGTVNISDVVILIGYVLNGTR